MLDLAAVKKPQIFEAFDSQLPPDGDSIIVAKKILGNLLATQQALAHENFENEVIILGRNFTDILIVTKQGELACNFMKL